MNAVRGFEEVLDHIFGVYLDGARGFHLLRENFVKGQIESMEMLRKEHPEKANFAYLDSVSISYGNGHPANPESVVLHRCSQGEYKARNEKSGVNVRFIGNMALVTLFQYWEHGFREKIAGQLGLPKEELRVPVLGDIRHFRNSIIHHDGVALKEVESCEVLCWFVEGDDVFIDKDKFEELVFQIKAVISGWKVKLRDTV